MAGGVVVAERTGPVLCVGFSPDGGLLAASGCDRRVALYDLIRRPARLAVAMALHPRLGAASELAALDPGVVRLIAHWIEVL